MCGVHAAGRVFRKCARVSSTITKWRKRIRKRYKDRRKGYRETEEETVEMRIKCRQRNRGCAAACNWIGYLPEEPPLPCFPVQSCSSSSSAPPPPSTLPCRRLLCMRRLSWALVVLADTAAFGCLMLGLIKDKRLREWWR